MRTDYCIICRVARCKRNIGLYNRRIRWNRYTAMQDGIRPAYGQSCACATGSAINQVACHAHREDHPEQELVTTHAADPMEEQREEHAVHGGDDELAGVARKGMDLCAYGIQELMPRQTALSAYAESDAVGGD